MTSYQVSTMVGRMKTTTLSATVPLSPAQFRAAADLAEQIETLQADLNAILSGGIVAGTPSVSKSNGKRKFSPSVRAKIAAGQRKAWAKRHKAQNAPTSPAAPATAPVTAPPNGAASTPQA